MDTAVKYDIEVLKEEARQLIHKGLVSRNQPIYALCKYIPGRDWVCVEMKLEENDFLLTIPLPIYEGSTPVETV